MSTTYQFEDGKIVFVYDQAGEIKLINVVHDDRTIANKVADNLIAWLKSFGK